MTVAELIKELEKQDPDAEVWKGDETPVCTVRPAPEYVYANVVMVE